jgi:two-component system sensor kinase FixL
MCIMDPNSSRDIPNETEAVDAPRADPALGEDEETLRAVVEDLTEFVVRWKPDGNRTFVNRAYADAFGGEPEDFVGTSLFPLIADEDRERIQRKIAEITPENPVATAEQRVHLPDGRIGWQEWTDRGLFRDDGSLAGYQSVGRDITERKGAEAALRLSEEKYEKAFNYSSSPNTISRISDGTFVDVNAAFIELTGLTRDEAVGRTSVDLGFMSAEARELLRRQMEAHGKLDNLEVEVQTKSGPRTALLSGFVVDVESEPHFFVSAEDITARTRAEESARKAWEFTQTALDSQIDTFFVFDVRTSRAVRWNRAFQEISGYSNEEIAQMPAPDSWYDDEDLGKARKAVEGIMREGVGTVEISLITKEGTRIPTEYRVSALTDDAGEVTHLISVGRDITDRKRAEETLRKNEERLNAIIDNIPAMTYTASVDGRISFISDNVQEIAGYTPEDFYGEDFGFTLRRVHPDDRESVKEALGKLATQGIPFDLEYRFRRKDGEWIWIGDRGAVTFEEKGVQSHYGMAFDITEKKRLENQVVEISDWERQRMGQELHDDLGQQLTGLAALSGSLKARLASEGRSEVTDAARIEEIATGAVLYTRNLARGLYPHDVTGGNLPEAIRSLGNSTEAVFGISCLVRVHGNFKGIREEEALHLFRICQESIHNAVRHGGAGKVSVSLEMQEGSLSLQIEDDGGGFCPGSVSEGMGLSVMRCRADLLGARLELETSPGEGTRIALSAPGLERSPDRAGEGRSK